MTEKPLISVIVPVYKVEAYLDRCVQSIVGQTYQNLEIILIDDGSPDDCGAMCDAWAEKDSRIRVIHQKNAGGGAARNTGLAAAEGELIAFVDSDDYLQAHMYEHLYALLDETVDIAECVMIMTESDDADMDDGSGAQVKVVDTEQALALHIRDEMFCQTPPNKLYRREVIADIRFPVGNLIDDEFFTYRVLGNARHLAHSSARMYAYRQQPDSAMHKPFSLKRLQGLYAKQQRLEYLTERMPNLADEARFELYFSCVFAMQGCLKSLPKEELEQARQIIGGITAKLTPVSANPQASRMKNILLKMAQTNFEGTCRLLNFLIDIHILT